MSLLILILLLPSIFGFVHYVNLVSSVAMNDACEFEWLT